jgi:hypothetical protein
VDLLLERSKAFEGSGVHAADYARNVSDVFPVLQKLTTGKQQQGAASRSCLSASAAASV